MIKQIFIALQEAYGYEIAECQDPSLYFHLMALQVGTLINPDAKEQMKSIKKIKLFCELCTVLLDIRIKAIDNFVEALSDQNQ